MEMTKVNSSHMRAVGYDPATRKMHIEFRNGQTYEYRGVPKEFHQTMMGAKSIGSFFHQNVQPHFTGKALN